MGTEPHLITVSVIATTLKVPGHRVEYVLRSRPQIRPAARAGNIRLFDRAAVAMVRHELNSIDARRCTKGVGLA